MTEIHDRLRVLLANPGLDGHDRGIKVVARALRDAGMEIIYLPLRTPVEQVVRVALQEDVDAVGISNLSANLVAICTELRRKLDEAGAADILIVAGGTVLKEDRDILARLGIDGVFGPGSNTRDIIEFIGSHVNSVKRRRINAEGTA